MDVAALLPMMRCLLARSGHVTRGRQGDSVETAVNIAHICRLVEKKARLYELVIEDSAEFTKAELEKRLRMMEREIVEKVQNPDAESAACSVLTGFINGFLFDIIEAKHGEMVHCPDQVLGQAVCFYASPLCPFRLGDEWTCLARDPGRAEA